MQNVILEITENTKVSSDVFKMKLKGDLSSIKNSGEFVEIKLDGYYLRRPISVCEFNSNELVLLYKVLGHGTLDMSTYPVGKKLDVLVGLGNGFDLSKEYGRVALVGGGIGVAPLLELAKRLRDKNKQQKIDLYTGFRDEIYLVDDFKEYVNEIKISTNTGKHGHKGFVTEILNVEEYDTVLCCGPEVMMKAVVEMCKEKNVKVYVSMEKHMACGVGACLVCTCKTKDGNKRTCKDGPVFDGYYVEL